jgi:hypothetical protein
MSLSSMSATPTPRPTGSFTAEAFAAHLARVPHAARVVARPQARRLRALRRAPDAEAHRRVLALQQRSARLTLDGFALPGPRRPADLATRPSASQGRRKLVFANNRLVRPRALSAALAGNAA